MFCQFLRSGWNNNCGGKYTLYERNHFGDTQTSITVVFKSSEKISVGGKWVSRQQQRFMPPATATQHCSGSCFHTDLYHNSKEEKQRERKTRFGQVWCGGTWWSSTDVKETCSPTKACGANVGLFQHVTQSNTLSSCDNFKPSATFPNLVGYISCICLTCSRNPLHDWVCGRRSSGAGWGSWSDSPLRYTQLVLDGKEQMISSNLKHTASITKGTGRIITLQLVQCDEQVHVALTIITRARKTPLMMKLVCEANGSRAGWRTRWVGCTCLDWLLHRLALVLPLHWRHLLVLRVSASCCFGQLENALKTHGWRSDYTTEKTNINFWHRTSCQQVRGGSWGVHYRQTATIGGLLIETLINTAVREAHWEG